MNSLWSFFLVCALALGAPPAHAKRLGSGLSIGKQSPGPTQRRIDAPATQPTQSPSAAARSDSVASAAPAPQRPSGAAALLGGLAAGLGLVGLVSSPGGGEGLGMFVWLTLFAMAAAMACGWFLVRRVPASQRTGWAYQSARDAGRSQFDPATPRGYSPNNVGNDASARPWESRTDEPGNGAESTSSQPSAVPAGFDVDGFLRASKANFVDLQDAWDRADMPRLRAMMTDGMLEQIKSQLAEREQHTGGQPNKTEVVMLDARLLGIEEFADSYMASVEFSGLVREEVSSGPNPFREIWNITRPKAGANGWLVAGVQALQ